MTLRWFQNSNQPSHQPFRRLAAKRIGVRFIRLQRTTTAEPTFSPFPTKFILNHKTSQQRPVISLSLSLCFSICGTCCDCPSFWFGSGCRPSRMSLVLMLGRATPPQADDIVNTIYVTSCSSVLCIYTLIVLVRRPSVGLWMDSRIVRQLQPSCHTLIDRAARTI